MRVSVKYLWGLPRGDIAPALATWPKQSWTGGSHFAPGFSAAAAQV